MKQWKRLWKPVWIIAWVCGARQGWGFQPLIVGGEEAARDEFPAMVSLQSDGWGHFCGATLVNPGWVLTAAHCVKDTVAPEKLKIVIGLHNLTDTQGVETFASQQVVIHPDYDKKGDGDWDFALIQLKGRSQFKPMQLNDAELNIPESEQQAPVATTAGWGVTSEQGQSVSPVLMKVDVPLVSAKRCSAAYKDQVTPRMLCAGFDAGKKDSCQGDSGGPLLMRDEAGGARLVGIVSWGEGCARPFKYGVYSKVSAAYAWILGKIS